jgi:KaiC/GvpD/RAD55 family RecA-like ATPase
LKRADASYRRGHAPPTGSAAEGSTASEQGRPAIDPDARISTGNAGLDEMLEGGVIARRPYLIVGPSGTGKTTLALQFLCEGVRRGERCLLVTIEEPPNEARLNHRGLGVEFEQVEVFDAIPDVMRYERVPFKDISQVRAATAFGRVPLVIRRTPELTGVEVTITALEQMLRSEVARRGYTRIVVDSLTALQYFCMKGFNEVAGAQTFLRFLSDLHVTTFLTVESPLEDVDTTERMLARGEIRLFRWELEESTVRAIGVEKFRGSSHDVRLHPYRIGPSGLDINLRVTVSRDTRRIIEPLVLVSLVPPPHEAATVTGSPLDPLIATVKDLVAIGADAAPVRTEIEAAIAAVEANNLTAASGHIARASSLCMDLAEALRGPTDAASAAGGASVETSAARQRVIARSETARAGVAPTRLPPAPELQRELEELLREIPATAGPPAPPVRPAAASPVGRERPAPVPVLAPERESAPEEPAEHALPEPAGPEPELAEPMAIEETAVPEDPAAAAMAPIGVDPKSAVPGEDVEPAVGIGESHEPPDSELPPPPRPAMTELEMPKGPPPPFPTRAAPAPTPVVTPAPPQAHRPEPARAGEPGPRHPSPPEPPSAPSSYPGKVPPAARTASPPSDVPKSATTELDRGSPSPRGAVHVAPPPLPTLPGGESSPPPRALPPVRQHPIHAPAAPVVAPAASPSAPAPGAPTESSAVPPAVSIRRKRKTPVRGVPKAEPTAPTPSPTLTPVSSPPEPSAAATRDAPSATAEPSVETPVPAPAKPRRKAVRKRKAPTVVSATQDPAPGENTPATGTPPPTSNPPAAETAPKEE